ncbi:hypothetical protein DPMN_059652, partial [Dreissena polymorpha]
MCQCYFRGGAKDGMFLMSRIFLQTSRKKAFENSVDPDETPHDAAHLRLSHPYSPYLAPMDFHVFPEVKSQLRGIRFASKQELTVAAKRIVSSFDAD